MLLVLYVDYPPVENKELSCGFMGHRSRR